jgi:hypothetical protein
VNIRQRHVVTVQVSIPRSTQFLTVEHDTPNSWATILIVSS